MRRKHLIISILLAVTALSAAAQEKPKTGWVFTPMPNVSYNTDLGLNLGAFCDFFYYGDGSSYPNPLHHVGFSGAYATKGSWYLHGYFDSVRLIPGLRLSASATYRDAFTNNFYGFNGIAAPFDPSLELNADDRVAYYTNRRRLLRAAASVQGNLGAGFQWLGGLVFRHVTISDFNLKNYDSGRSLYLAYHDAGLVRDDEFGGGNSLELKLGATYDTRNVELFPSKGIYAEAYVLGNADLGRWKYNYAQVVAHWRHYVSLGTDRVILAYHLGLQHTIAGEVPFYNINELATLSYLYEECSGLGSRYSVRGFRYNRLAAAGYAWANIELRVTVLRFNLFKQHFDIVVNPFTDLAAITKTYRLEEQKLLPGLYQDLKLPVAPSAGMGIKLHMNTNFILSLDAGYGFNPQLGDLTIGMSTTYVF